MIIFEIFSEEIPATLQKKIAIDYKDFVAEKFKKKCKKDDIFVGITLNRLVLKIDGCDISCDELKDFIEITLKDFSKNFPRTMCYPQSDIRWIRPIRNIFACIDDKIIKHEFFGLKTSNGTFVNKFIFHSCNSCEDYLKFLKKNKIEIDYEKRLEFIKNKIISLKIDNQDKYFSLAEEIAGMEECYSKPVECELDKKFKILPFELIKLVLQKNQRYLVYKKDKNIKYLIFCGAFFEDKKKCKMVIDGHKKVVEARLKDAMYYWNLDQEKMDSLKKKYKEELKDILMSRLFVNDVSWKTYLEKQIDFASKFISSEVVCKKVKELIFDTKIDLVTDVVNEFPELQGIIGGIYFGYNFNPYLIGEVDANEKDVLKVYYYLIDRLAYISEMYDVGNQPTGRGDKFKVKKRMDDFIYMVFNKKLDKIDRDNVINFIKNKPYFELYLKRKNEIFANKTENNTK